jgi:hypothetical protein
MIMTSNTVDLAKVRQLKALKEALFGKYDLSPKDPLIRHSQWAHRERLVSIKTKKEGGQITCQIALTGEAIAMIEQHGHLVP